MNNICNVRIVIAGIILFSVVSAQKLLQCILMYVLYSCLYYRIIAYLE